MTEATGWPSEPPPEVVAPEPAPAPPVEPAPVPDWLAEVRNNVGGIVGVAIEELFKLITGG